MAGRIVKSPYCKCSGSTSLSGYLRYIATRERVELLPDDRPPTRKQEQLITKLVKDFPDSKKLYEYEDYIEKPTKSNASALITMALESNWDKLSNMEGYAVPVRSGWAATAYSVTKMVWTWRAPCLNWNSTPEMCGPTSSL